MRRFRLTFAFLLTLVLIVSALAADSAKDPLRLNRVHLSGVDLETVPPIVPSDRVISGSLENNKLLTLFEGQDLIARVFASASAKTVQTEPLGVDEYVYILSGVLVLTSSHGRQQTFVAGDAFIVPKGFKGTWEMQGDYRELVVHKPNP